MSHIFCGNLFYFDREKDSSISLGGRPADHFGTGGWDIDTDGQLVVPGGGLALVKRHAMDHQNGSQEPLQLIGRSDMLRSEQVASHLTKVSVGLTSGLEGVMLRLAGGAEASANGGCVNGTHVMQCDKTDDTLR